MPVELSHSDCRETSVYRSSAASTAGPEWPKMDGTGPPGDRKGPQERMREG